MPIQPERNSNDISTTLRTNTRANADIKAIDLIVAAGSRAPRKQLCESITARVAATLNSEENSLATLAPAPLVSDIRVVTGTSDDAR